MSVTAHYFPDTARKQRSGNTPVALLILRAVWPRHLPKWQDQKQQAPLMGKAIFELVRNLLNQQLAAACGPECRFLLLQVLKGRILLWGELFKKMENESYS